ncbi:CidA/LrgA family protein [Evansella clarkii]|uniref:CidA/LrgA family protein n=1 Tax=Evansella clarkii TaxID=79879 RepID=UPI000998BE11|nr:CidA/LrgA family protein [Evansella clarkii]
MKDALKLAGGLLVIIVFYMVGRLINSYLLPLVPGSIIGMLLLFTVLMIFGEKLSQWLQDGAKLLIKYLPLFFVPVTVGIIQYDNLVSLFGLFFFSLMMASSFIVLVLLSSLLERTAGKKEKSVSWD